MKKNLGTVKCVHELGKILFMITMLFLSLKVSRMDDYLDKSSSERVDLVVFLNRPAYFPYCFCESPRSCTDHQVISFAQDLFAAFCSVLIRMYLNN